MSEPRNILTQYIEDSMALLRTANIVLPQRAKANVYHHAGVESIYRIGAMFINVVERDYCKSFVVMQAGQSYPSHFHRIKTESMYALYGVLTITIDGVEHILHPGEILHIERGQDHAFYTETGAVFEEISTTYILNDSVYLDAHIRQSPYTYRRTVINEQQWEVMIHAEG